MKIKESFFRNHHRPNHSLYLFMLAVALFIMIPLEKINDPTLFAIVSGVGSGGIASILVAWLLDYVNCRNLNLRDSNIRLQQFLPLVLDFAEFFDQFPVIVENLQQSTESSEGERTWYEWLSFIPDHHDEKLDESRLQVVRKKIEQVNDRLEEIEKTKLEIMLGQILTNSEFNSLLRIKTDLLIFEYAIKSAIEDNGLLIELINEMKTHISDARIVCFFNEVKYSREKTIYFSLYEKKED